MMNKRLNTRTQRLHDGATATGERRWTRLSKDAEQDVLDLATVDYPVANVIRDLVDEALHVRHLNKAGRHPAVRELLRTFDEIINVRVQQAAGPLSQHVARLEAQVAQANRFLAAFFLTHTEKFVFTTDKSDQELENSLFVACADEANAMTQVILRREPVVAPTESSQASLRLLVAQELNTEPAP